MARGTIRRVSGWTLGRRLSTVLVAIAAAAIAGSLFAEWHVVQAAELVDADAFFGAIYTGPDYEPSPGARADMLARSIGTRSWTCTGLEHVGVGALVGSIAVALAAMVTARWPPRSSVTRPAAVTAILALALAGFSVAQSTLRHVLDRVGPNTVAAHVFDLAVPVLALTAVAIVASAIVEGRRSSGR